MFAYNLCTSSSTLHIISRWLTKLLSEELYKQCKCCVNSCHGVEFCFGAPSEGFFFFFLIFGPAAGWTHICRILRWREDCNHILRTQQPHMCPVATTRVSSGYLTGQQSSRTILHRFCHLICCNTGLSHHLFHLIHVLLMLLPRFHKGITNSLCLTLDWYSTLPSLKSSSFLEFSIQQTN